MINFTPLTYEEVKGGNEATGKRLNVTEANILMVITEADEQEISVTADTIALITGYTTGQVTHALAGLKGMGAIH